MKYKNTRQETPRRHAAESSCIVNDGELPVMLNRLTKNELIQLHTRTYQMYYIVIYWHNDDSHVTVITLRARSTQMTDMHTYGENPPELFFFSVWAIWLKSRPPAFPWRNTCIKFFTFSLCSLSFHLTPYGIHHTLLFLSFPYVYFPGEKNEAAEIEKKKGKIYDTDKLKKAADIILKLFWSLPTIFRRFSHFSYFFQVIMVLLRYEREAKLNN